MVLPHSVTYTEKINIIGFRFILEPLITKNDHYSYAFYKRMIEKMKNHTDSLKPDDQLVNHVKLIQILRT